MRQREVNQAVAKVTGESIRTVRQFGFSLVSPITLVLPLHVKDAAPRRKKKGANRE